MLPCESAEDQHGSLEKKIEKNIERDQRNIRELKSLGWTPLTIWGCEVHKHNLEEIEKKIVAFLAEQ